jgi:surface protein
MAAMFKGASLFTSDLSRWNVVAVTSMNVRAELLAPTLLPRPSLGTERHVALSRHVHGSLALLSQAVCVYMAGGVGSKSFLTLV